MNFINLYVLDTETTGLDASKNDVIELSIIRLATDEQRTWCLKPINFEDISLDALRVNGHKLEDLKGLTKDGRERYCTPNKILVEVENWLMEDGVTPKEPIRSIKSIPSIQCRWSLSLTIVLETYQRLVVIV